MKRLGIRQYWQKNPSSRPTRALRSRSVNSRGKYFVLLPFVTLCTEMKTSNKQNLLQHRGTSSIVIRANNRVSNGRLSRSADNRLEYRSQFRFQSAREFKHLFIRGICLFICSLSPKRTITHRLTTEMGKYLCQELLFIATIASR